jgi:GT2 family glycosyltransferase
MTYMLHVAIVIVNWNGKQDTLQCLKSIQKMKTSDYRVMVAVVDNGSTDGSIETIREKFPHVHIIENKINLGFTGGNNVGIAWALKEGAQHVWLLNNDTLVDSFAVSELISALKDKKIGIVGSKIYFAKGYEFHKDRYKPNERGKVIWFAGGIIDWENMYASHRGVDEVDKGQFDRQEETSFVTGCSMMVRRDVFKAIGMLDDRYYLYLEDVNFCLRAQKAGFKTVYVPSSRVWHVNA